MPKSKVPASRPPANVPIAPSAGLSGWVIGAAVWGTFAVLVWAFIAGA